MTSIRRTILALLAIAALAVAPHLVSSHLTLMLALIATTSITVAGLSVVTGAAGQISIAQAAFCAIGAYGASLAAVHLGLPMWLTIPLAAIVAALVGYALGLATLRVEGHYLALVTLAFSGIVHLGLVHLKDLTGGSIGMPVQSLELFGFAFSSPLAQYYLFVSVAVLVFWGVSNLLRSRWGRAFHALRQSEVAAMSVAIDVRRTKSLAFAVSAALGALGGALGSLQSTYLDPVQFTIIVSVIYLSIPVLGGLRHISGAVIGSTIYVLLPEMLGGFDTYMGLIFAAALLAVILTAPAGLADLAHRLAPALRKGSGR